LSYISKHPNLPFLCGTTKLTLYLVNFALYTPPLGLVARGDIIFISSSSVHFVVGSINTVFLLISLPCPLKGRGK